MSGRFETWFRQPLLADRPVAETRGKRILLLLLWLAVTGWLAAHHVPWRDEVRAWSLTMMASSWPDLFRVVQGEGHPYLWYMLLRAGDQLFGVREVLPALGLVIGIAAAALLAIKSPFRLGVLFILLFSLHLGFDYSVVSRNYGLSALILFIIASTYARVKNSAWFGLQLLALCNVNAPSVLIAGALFLYRILELAIERPPLRSRRVGMLLVNGGLLLTGTLFCFLAIYPSVNDAAAASNSVPLTWGTALQGLVDAQRSFAAYGFDKAPVAANAAILLSLLLFGRSLPAIGAALAAFLTMKLFFFFVYPAGYRHAALFLMLLVALHWMEAVKNKAAPEDGREPSLLSLIGAWTFVSLLAMQSVLYLRWPVIATVQSRPWSNAANLASVVQRPENRGAILMYDPDALGESLVYYTGEPFWQLRQGGFGTVVPFSLSGNRHMRFGDFLRDAASLHSTTGRPVLIVLQRDLGAVKPGRYDVMYGATTTYTPQEVARFLGSTRKVASFRRAFSDENYDVYRYPR